MYFVSWLKKQSSKSAVWIVTALPFLTSSCGIPSAGCGDGVACIEDPATENLAEASDIFKGKIAYNTKGEEMLGTLEVSRLLPSTALRSKTSDSLELSTQKQDSQNTLSSLYVLIPDILTGVHSDSSEVVPINLSAFTTCGTTQNSVEARIEDCKELNAPNSTTWDGRIKGNHSDGSWTLVSKTAAGNAVWRDDSSGLIWSDDLGLAGGRNWCVAAGNNQLNTNCENGALQTSPAQSLCAEDAGLTVPSETMDAKGNLNKADHGVHWRLPSKADWLQAELNGVRWVIQKMDAYSNPPTKTYWTSTTLGIDPSGTAWTLNSLGEFSVNAPALANMGSLHSTICVAGYSQEDSE